MKNGLGPSYSHPYFCPNPKQRFYVFPKDSLLHTFLSLRPYVCVWKVFIFSPLGAILCHSPTAKACCLFCLKLSDLESQVPSWPPFNWSLNCFVVKHPVFIVAVMMGCNPNTTSVVPQIKENKATRYNFWFPCCFYCVICWSIQYMAKF